MNLWQTFINTGVVAVVAVLVAYFFKDRFDAVNQRFDAVDQRFDAVDQRFDAVNGRIERLEAGTSAQFEKLEATMNDRFGQVDQRLNLLTAETAAVRSDLLQVALAVGAHPRPQAS